MKRENFIKIIKLRSVWRIDKRMGNYLLPSGSRLSVYVENLVRSQLEVDHLGIAKDGSMEPCTTTEWDKEKKVFSPYTLMAPFEDNETCSYEEMESRIRKLVEEITG